MWILLRHLTIASISFRITTAYQSSNSVNLVKQAAFTLILADSTRVWDSADQYVFRPILKTHKTRLAYYSISVNMISWKALSVKFQSTLMV
jgi:hypothetical protein